MDRTPFVTLNSSVGDRVIWDNALLLHSATLTDL
jgi:alpha-ketoglutarate-dependent taurine dioxygenase